jgi:RNA ligase (TIGR02306 family)
METVDRKLASIRMIDEINPIENADAIEVATIGGWKVVVKKGEFKAGELAVYFEIDSWIPVELAPFLCKGTEPRVYGGVRGERLRTIRLRGQISQGLLLPLEPTCANIASQLFEGLDVTFPLNIQKWEAPINAQLAGMARGNFPQAVPKTDQERIQNLKKELETYRGKRFEITEKLDGSSCTFYMDTEGEFHVCSRNLDLKEDENNSFWKEALRIGLREKMLEDFKGIAIQGELIGEGIQGNQYQLKGQAFRVFDVYNVNSGKYFDTFERQAIIDILGLQHAPIIGVVTLEGQTIEELLKYAENKSALNGSEREGLVWKCVDNTHISFKTISNRWLIRNAC